MGVDMCLLLVSFLTLPSVFSAPGRGEPLWNNEGLFTEIHSTAEAGSETNFGQTNINIKDYSHSSTNIGHGKPHNSHSDSDSDDDNSSIEFGKSLRSTPWDSGSSEHSRGWDNRGLFTRIYHNAKKGSTTNIGKTDTVIMDYSRRRTNIFGSSSSESECADTLEDGTC